MLQHRSKSKYSIFYFWRNVHFDDKFSFHFVSLNVEASAFHSLGISNNQNWFSLQSIHTTVPNGGLNSNVKYAKIDLLWNRFESNGHTVSALCCFRYKTNEFKMCRIEDDYFANLSKKIKIVPNWTHPLSISEWNVNICPLLASALNSCCSVWSITPWKCKTIIDLMCRQWIDSCRLLVFLFKKYRKKNIIA